ncbi:hypothetical protein TNCV_426551 [Trichonephila clavipes]|nr:hypothetical protein TNCV_426551 [Trichonephila clavipes]
MTPEPKCPLKFPIQRQNLTTWNPGTQGIYPNSALDVGHEVATLLLRNRPYEVLKMSQRWKQTSPIIVE